MIEGVDEEGDGRDRDREKERRGEGEGGEKSSPITLLSICSTF